MRKKIKVIDLRQKELHEWQDRNFGTKPDDDKRCAWGMVEETGELCHFLLKRKQGIREGNGHDCKAEIGDAYADIIIYGIQMLTTQGIDVQELVYKGKFTFNDLSFDNLEYIEKIRYYLVDKIVQGVAKINFRLNNPLPGNYLYAESAQSLEIRTAFRKVFYAGAKLVELEGLDPEKVLSETISKVLKRDWRKNPTGKGMSQHNQGEVDELLT